MMQPPYDHEKTDHQGFRDLIELCEHNNIERYEKIMECVGSVNNSIRGMMDHILKYDQALYQLTERVTKLEQGRIVQ